MISVAITTYNGSKFIIQQLKSIMNQSVKVNEVVIIDDISKDNTVELVRNFINENKLDTWNIYVNDSNLGFSDNFFKAVKKTKGDIIFIADQDDEWEFNKVEIMSTYMKTNPDIMLLFSGNTTINAEGKILELPKKTDKKATLNEIPFANWIFRQNALGCSMCIRSDIRDIITKYGGPQLKNSLGHDWYFGILSSIFGRSCNIETPLLRRRVHGENISLGYLRKRTLLSATNETRIGLLKQSIDAHIFLLNNPEISNKLSDLEKKQIELMINYYRKRVNFTSNKRLFNGIFIIFNIREYYKHQKNIKDAIKLCITDILYSYNINWKINGKEFMK